MGPGTLPHSRDATSCSQRRGHLLNRLVYRDKRTGKNTQETEGCPPTYPPTHVKRILDRVGLVGGIGWELDLSLHMTASTCHFQKRERLLAALALEAGRTGRRFVAPVNCGSIFRRHRGQAIARAAGQALEIGSVQKELPTSIANSAHSTRRGPW